MVWSARDSFKSQENSFSNASSIQPPTSRPCRDAVFLWIVSRVHLVCHFESRLCRLRNPEWGCRDAETTKKDWLRREPAVARFTQNVLRERNDNLKETRQSKGTLFHPIGDENIRLVRAFPLDWSPDEALREENIGYVSKSG